MDISYSTLLDDNSLPILPQKPKLTREEKNLMKNLSCRKSNTFVLHIAVLEGNLSKVQCLLSQGRDPNHRVYSKNLCSRYYCASKLRSFMPDFLDCHEPGSGWNWKTEDWSLTPLHLAATMHNPEMLELLVRYKANVNVETHGGVTPLLVAVLSINKPAVETLLKLGASLKVKTTWGWNVIHYAAWVGDMLDTLIDYGANPNIQNMEGETPMHLVTKYGHESCARSLLDHGADPRIKTIKELNVTGYAVMFGRWRVLEDLLAYGVSVECVKYYSFVNLTLSESERECVKRIVEQAEKGKLLWAGRKSVTYGNK